MTSFLGSVPPENTSGNKQSQQSTSTANDPLLSVLEIKVETVEPDGEHCEDATSSIQDSYEFDDIASISQESDAQLPGGSSLASTDNMNQSAAPRASFQRDQTQSSMVHVPAVPLGTYSVDPADWGHVTNDMLEYFSHAPIRNTTTDFSASERTYPDRKRVLSSEHFRRRKVNGETVQREWLIYSPTTGSVFCVPCKLYSNSTQALATAGFSDWKNAGARFKDHENSADHRACVVKHTVRATQQARIDYRLVVEQDRERKYWRNVLHRVIAVVKFLAERGLPFRGSDEILGSPHNGCFLGCLELISSFDSFLADHLKKFGGAGRGNTNYLSSTTCDEFIELLAAKVISAIVSELKEAKY
jgi:hypothetical protein